MAVIESLNEKNKNGLLKIDLLSIYNITEKELEIILRGQCNIILDIDFDLEKFKIL